MLDHSGNIAPDDFVPNAEYQASRKQRVSLGKSVDRRRTVANLFFLVFLAVVIAWIGWHRGRAPAGLFAIHGSSMAPTLLGEHHVVGCVACGLDWPVTMSGDESPIYCFHCGKQVQVSERIHAASRVILNEKLAVTTDVLRPGDVVALRGESMLRVKRIAAVPGDTIELDGAYLIVNGKSVVQRMGREQQLTLPLPILPFELDHRRSQSRWSGKSWRRSHQRIWESSDASWLVYHHRSIHQQNQSSVVWDDYPCNVDVDRKLQLANRFVLTAEVACQGEALLEVAFWLNQQPCAVVQRVTVESNLVVSSDDATVMSLGPVAGEYPVAIRVLEGSVHLSRLVVARQIEYRLRPQDDRTLYPIQLGRGEYFVLGDNVPVSVDSRDFGVISSDSIKGSVELFQSP
ncbi:MAG: S26 family signal peptidase [Rubripirellula sp.]|nr:S26 family signal peptidase [Rubripirellula sp.]